MTAFLFGEDTLLKWLSILLHGKPIGIVVYRLQLERI